MEKFPSSNGSRRYVSPSGVMVAEFDVVVDGRRIFCKDEEDRFPTAKEILRDGDVLALTGTQEAIAAARKLLEQV